MNMQAEALRSQVIHQVHKLHDVQKLHLLGELIASWNANGAADDNKAQLWQEPASTSLNLEQLKQEQDYISGGVKNTFGALQDMPESLETLLQQLND